MMPVRAERLSFFVKSVRVVPEGWRLDGEPGYHPQHWARPGDRFDSACGKHGRPERDVNLVVVEVGGSHAIVAGFGGDQLQPDGILSCCYPCLRRRIASRHMVATPPARPPATPDQKR